PVEERAPEIVPKTVALLNDGDLEELEALFAKFVPTNDKLKSYFDDLFVVYEEIREFLTEIMNRAGADAEKDKVRG
uniref:Uncharacterized protein n=1 Tax=Romanomermis culicivorax TaxID=13658 RepID=A0A915LBS0_ROMCU